MLGGDTEHLSRSAGTLGFVEVTATRRDGATATLRIDKPRGSPERPLDWTDLHEKFLDCGRHASLAATQAQQLFDAWRGIGEAASAQQLIQALAV
jgi:2-methylcitrate dehydratase PrpD